MRVFIFSGLNSLLKEQDRVRYLRLATVQECFCVAEDILRRRFDMNVSFQEMANSQKENIYSLRNINLTTTLILSLQVGIARHVLAQGLQPDWITGISLGDIARTVMSGALDFEEAVQISNVNEEEKRGLDQYGESVAVLCGPSRSFEMSDVERINEIGVGSSQISPRLLNVSGTYRQIEALRDLARRQNWRTLHLLNYPFHSMALSPYSKNMALFLNQVQLRNPQTPLFSTTLIQPLQSAEEIREEQKLTITHPHHWLQSARALIQHHGAREFVNIGPCQTLSKALFDMTADLASPPRIVEAMDLLS